MKKNISIIASLILAIFMSTSIVAQEGSGTIVYEIVEASSDDPQAAQFAEMMKGTETLVYFKDKESLTKINMMGGLIKVDLKKDKEENLDMLVDAMGQKMWVNSPKLEQDRLKAEADDPMEYMEIEYDMDDTKTIAGYECFKMSVDFPDAEGFRLEAYVTDQVDVRPSIIQGVDIADFKGLPLEYKFLNPQMNLTVSAKSFDDTVDASVFELNTAGFQKLTMKEFLELTQQFGGGGGFGF